MPKPDKNDASNGLNLGHEVLQKKNLQEDFELGWTWKLNWKKVWSPDIPRRFRGEPRAPEQQPKRGTTCLLLQYGFELRSGGKNKSLCSQY